MNATQVTESNQVALVERIRTAVASAHNDRNLIDIVVEVLEDEQINLRNDPSLEEMKVLLAEAHRSRHLSRR